MGLKRQPVRRQIRSAGLAPGSAGLSVRGIEITQTVQDMQNSVTLIADKATVVRVYLDASSLANIRVIGGEVAWRRDNSAESYLPSLNTVRLRPNRQLSLTEQRHDVAASLNFRLPTDAVAAGSLTVRLNRLFVAGGEDVPSVGATPVTVDFQTTPPLLIRVVGLRYRKDTNVFVSPDAVHFTYLRSYLERAYPVAQVVWSQVVVDADFFAPFNDSTAVFANAQLAAIRSREISTGIDPKTHYFGLVADNNGRDFMRGRAFDIPAQARPDTVASGPAGVPNGYAGDDDASYADWYGAHELGHTFGRFHPGFPPGRQDASDPTFPYPGGQLSTNDDRYVGFDVGDANLSLSMQALPGRMYHDVMTYADDQWLSAYTYEGVRVRLMAEAAL